jgi:hypothetical protein
MFNGSSMLNDPWNTTFSPYIHLLGQGWLIVPLAFIGAALFVKTRDTAMIAVYLIVVGGFMSIGSAWGGFAGASVLFMIMAAVGIAALMYNLFYGGK